SAPLVTTALCMVASATGRVAASSKFMFEGARNSRPWSASVYSANAAPPEPMILSPTLTPFASGPSSATSPAHSMPSTVPTPPARQHGFEPAANDRFGVAHDARHQFGAGRNIVDQALDLAGRPDAFIGISRRVDHLAAGAGDEFAHVLEFRAFPLHRDDLGGDRVPGDARGVAHGAENQFGRS